MNLKKPKAILVDVIAPETSKSEALKRLEELENLVNTYGGIVVVKIIQKKGTPNYDTYIGKGKVKEILESAKKKGAEVVVINNILKPRQIFKLNEIFREEKMEMKAWDRIDLILKIFSKHAQSTEAKLQIELAGIRHMGPRIFGMGIELSRQAGAMGLRAGAGEANIEMMKRHLRKQELNIMKKLKHYDVIRAGHRKRRRRKNLKTAALVGYTNSGKSTLLNALTRKGAYVADKLFATLDTKVGKLYFAGTDKIKDGKYIGGNAILVSDTIGFIQDLPPSLIQAFKSTLSETIEADLILHVIDINDSQINKNIEVVEEILEQLGLMRKPKIYVFNKIDLVKMENEPKEEKPKPKSSLMKAGKGTARALGWHTSKDAKKISTKILKNKYRKFSPVFVSAIEKTNLKGLIRKIDEKVEN